MKNRYALYFRSDKYNFHSWPPSMEEINELVHDPNDKKEYVNLLNWWKSISSEYKKKAKKSKLI